MNQAKFQAPAHLSDRAKEIWAELVPKNARTAGRMALLRSGLEALDTADRARKELGDGSLISKTLTTGTPHIHPLVKLEREARAQFASIWATLGLNHYGADQWDYQSWLKRQEQEQ